ncbi:METTL15 [Bugula neritina]|uniref:METTL15 n=1 Tax=Bugula neritina TaxID=10212 RepID=A0A7J7KP73_BUGNE|nr:METTL15 [Bugula neritina]
MLECVNSSDVDELEDSSVLGTLVGDLSISSGRLVRIKAALFEDEVGVVLLQYITEGWPNIKDRVRLLHGSFTDIVEILRGQGHSTANIADGILFDVGASSMQYSNRDRGFSVTNNGPLDMRMNRDEETPTAADVVNKLEEKDLYKILKKYGEEKLSRQIARLVVEYRQMMGPITTTKDLREVVSEVYRAAEATRKVDKAGRKQHAATLTFQALRIFVNDELNQLYNGLKIAHLLLKPNGICAVISFHSLEHNVTHQVFNTKHAIDKQTLVTPNLHQTAFLYPWKCDSSVIKPSEEEVTQNPRSRSAELRVAFKKSVQR